MHHNHAYLQDYVLPSGLRISHADDPRSDQGRKYNDSFQPLVKTTWEKEHLLALKSLGACTDHF